ncbi:MAG TPA: N-formylglutamate amidohydrolase [Sphingobium sp.]|jgi:predicted N-formylglutamate amidohydrolase|uniref:N-formylglutamate amidohydrolase n=1 Tax=unclassified Sphingobium TaxID=2611147 RepID=UPI0007F5114A|nr:MULTISPECIES: N-formylglutamate amidohydrolase [unclassified Sphingobium]OAN59057.1 N-formylglutamate amidohydrolase [Sphingobium sp. TCM1]HAF40798.1 N-formylglutamate amidohydrolase [Sphingobium sp.]
MSEAFTRIDGGDLDLLIVADHASAHVPGDIHLGIDPALLEAHIAIDIGVAEVSGLLAAQLGCTAILGAVSRLVIDLNREEDAPGLLPVMSDGHAIPGNRDADLPERMLRFHHPYHHQLGRILDEMTSPFILSVHSFTPRLASDPEQERPWDIGILYNQDDRAARIAIPLLEAAGLKVGDQLPYSGQLLNATMNRHAEANGIPYLGIEMRQDLVSDAAGQRRFAEIIGPIALDCRSRLA